MDPKKELLQKSCIRRMRYCSDVEGSDMEISVTSDAESSGTSDVEISVTSDVEGSGGLDKLNIVLHRVNADEWSVTGKENSAVSYKDMSVERGKGKILGSHIGSNEWSIAEKENFAVCKNQMFVKPQKRNSTGSKKKNSANYSDKTSVSDDTGLSEGAVKSFTGAIRKSNYFASDKDISTESFKCNNENSEICSTEKFSEFHRKTSDSYEKTTASNGGAPTTSVFERQTGARNISVFDTRQFPSSLEASIPVTIKRNITQEEFTESITNILSYEPKMPSVVIDSRSQTETPKLPSAAGSKEQFTDDLIGPLKVAIKLAHPDAAKPRTVVIQKKLSDTTSQGLDFNDEEVPYLFIGSEESVGILQQFVAAPSQETSEVPTFFCVKRLTSTPHKRILFGTEEETNKIVNSILSSVETKEPSLVVDNELLTSFAGLDTSICYIIKLYFPNRDSMESSTGDQNMTAKESFASIMKMLIGPEKGESVVSNKNSGSPHIVFSRRPLKRQTVGAREMLAMKPRPIADVSRMSTVVCESESYEAFDTSAGSSESTLPTTNLDAVSSAAADAVSLATTQAVMFSKLASSRPQLPVLSAFLSEFAEILSHASGKKLYFVAEVSSLAPATVSTTSPGVVLSASDETVSSAYFGVASSRNSGTVSYRNSGAVSSKNSGAVSSRNSGAVSSRNSGAVSSRNSGAVLS